MAQRTLIAFQTKSGVTKENASIIAGVLQGEFGHQVDLVDLKVSKIPDITLYDNILIGSGIRIHRWYGKPRKLMKDKRLAVKRVVIFLSSGEAGEDAAKATEKYKEKICQKYKHLNPVECAAFGGRIPGDQKNDFRDPEKVRVWAKRVGRKLR